MLHGDGLAELGKKKGWRTTDTAKGSQLHLDRLRTECLQPGVLCVSQADNIWQQGNCYLSSTIADTKEWAPRVPCDDFPPQPATSEAAAESASWRSRTVSAVFPLHPCLVCDAIFCSRPTLQKHISMHVSADGIVCKVCHHHCASYQDLKEHFGKHHYRTVDCYIKTRSDVVPQPCEEATYARSEKDRALQAAEPTQSSVRDGQAVA